MAGEWIPEKARGLIGKIFPGTWEETQAGVFQGRCPGEHLHHGANAETDCRIHVAYSEDGNTAPGAFCLHKSCADVLAALNKEFRDAIFAKDGEWQGKQRVDDGVVKRAPVSREPWIPEFNIGKLRGLVSGVPRCEPRFFIERSPIDPRKVTPGEFIEHMFRPGERVLVFTEFKGPGDFLWEVGKGGFRLGAERGIQAVRSNLPTDGGREGVWYLVNPVDGQWYGNPRRAGKMSRRSLESVTRWPHMIVESDETKIFKLKADAVKLAHAQMEKDNEEGARLHLMDCAGEKWADKMMEHKGNFPALEAEFRKAAEEMPGLWNRFLAMAPLSIKAIYSSGGHSWHALVDVNMATKAEFDALLRNVAKRTLPALGADPGAMTPIRLSRLPGCTRGGNLQQLIYCNPNPSPAGVPIRDLPKLRTV